jgi:hypothetical protein
VRTAACCDKNLSREVKPPVRGEPARAGCRHAMRPAGLPRGRMHDDIRTWLRLWSLLPGCFCSQSQWADSGTINPASATRSFRAFGVVKRILAGLRGIQIGVGWRRARRSCPEHLAATEYCPGIVEASAQVGWISMDTISTLSLLYPSAEERLSMFICYVRDTMIDH